MNMDDDTMMDNFFITLAQLDDGLNQHRKEVIGHCSRCQMICIDQENGAKDASLLLALRDYRLGSKITFGIYLQLEKGYEGAMLNSAMSVSYTI
uniref:Molybdenum cofactor sulfurase n=1 Tax=Parascaris univalens TaxID=6257 RepID=A0A915CFD2_PARUN